MASRGMLPLPPVDQLAVLYQLAIDADATIAQNAKITALGLPEKLLAGTLADPNMDPRVLDYYGALVGVQKATVFDAIVLNPAVADATLATLAGRTGARETDLIAQNEQRLLRHPEIIAALYMNRHARMSTVDRVVELAERHGLRVPGLAAWDEVARALTGATPTAPDQDAIFAQAADALTGDDSELTTGDPDEVLPDAEDDAAAPPPIAAGKIPINKLSIPSKIRLATLGHAFARSQLVRDPMRLVAMAAIKSPGVSEIEAARYASNQGLSDDVIRYIAQKREWTKLYGIKVALCRNPKTPMQDAARLLPFMRDKDLQNLMKSKGVPSALAAQARKLMMQRRGGNK
jgi:hypothetical protein